MTQIFKTVLSMSLSGAVLIVALLLGIRLLKGRLGRQWQYYIWLIVVMRLLLPFGPEASLMGQAHRAVDRMTEQMKQGTQGAWLSGEDSANPAQGVGQSAEESIERRGRQNAGADTEWSDGQNTEPNSTQDTVQQGLEAVGETAEEPVAENDRMMADSLRQADGKEASLGTGQVFLRAAAFAGNYLWVIWLIVASGMLIRKGSMYQSYIKYVKAGAEPVCDLALLDQLAVTADQLGIGRTVELCVNPLVSSPMLVGYRNPCIVLPDADVPEKDFQYIVMHELTHYKRRDIWYKWLVQFAVCLHWFNPFVHLMSREIDRACEFACDEAVVAKMGYGYAADYGKTLLNAMAAGGTFREPLAVITMSANKELLRERLGAIMSFNKKTKKAGIITAGLTVGIALGAVFIGVYPASASEPDKAGMSVTDSAEGTGISDKDKAAVAKNMSETAASDGILTQKKADSTSNQNGVKGTAEQGKPEAGKEAAWSDAEKYYKAGSLPQFYIAFGELDEKAQEKWLDRIYADGNHSFFSVSVKRLDADSPLVQTFAQKFYEDDEVAFFSILADEIMSEETLEGWLDQALSDQKWNFQSMLYDKLNRDEEKDELDKALEEEQREAYRLVGVTWNGKNCYYEGQLVNIFLDIHMPNRSFYTLDMNPAGTVNIKIIRSADGQITGVAYMTEAEVAELFGDIYGEGEDSEATAAGREGKTGAGVTEADKTETEADASDKEFPREMTVVMPVCRIREGAGADSLVVGLLGEGETVTVLGKKEDTDGQIWYLLDQESLAENPDPSVEECYIRGDLLEEK